MLKLLDHLNRFVWGMPALLMIVGVGLYLSFRTGFAQVRLFPRAIRQFLRQFKKRKGSEEGSSYRALCTALAATVGTGNIAGVAGAIVIGGPGAIFWMWMCAVLGMVTKFAEATLAVRYCRRDTNGELVGGPMYMIEKGMPASWKWLAVLYCFFGTIAAFGVGNATQINAVIGSINGAISSFGVSVSNEWDLLAGIAIAVFVLIVLLGGAKRIGTIAERLVPFAAVGYMLLCIIVLILRRQALPGAFSSIVQGAFSPKAVTGGMIGSAFTALRIGASRGVFTNEAGMGTAAIAHGSSEVAHPVFQGLMGIIEVFLDTVVICTLTALVILCSGAEVVYGLDTGVLLTTEAFASVLGEWVTVPLVLAVCCFAVATILGWGYYGIRCTQYLFGEGSWRCYAYLQGVVMVVCSALGTGTVWTLAETINGLMAIPNLIVLAYLAPELQRLTCEFRKKYRFVRKANLTKV